MVENLIHSARRIGMRRCAPSVSLEVIGEQTVAIPLWMSKSTWAHTARECARRQVWRQVAKDRERSGDSLGIQRGVDRDATMAPYERFDWRRQGIMRSVLLGAVWTQERRSKMPGNVDGPVCQHCGSAHEDLEHLWWRCEAWKDARERVWGDTQPNPTNLPKWCC